jgi:hypothetical protein
MPIGQSDLKARLELKRLKKGHLLKLAMLC